MPNLFGFELISDIGQAIVELGESVDALLILYRESNSTCVLTPGYFYAIGVLIFWR